MPAIPACLPVRMHLHPPCLHVSIGHVSIRHAMRQHRHLLAIDAADMAKNATIWDYTQKITQT
jgi:hypothetical protein